MLTRAARLGGWVRNAPCRARALRRMEAEGGGAAAVARALRAVRSLGDEDRAWVERIEAVRAGTGACRDVVRFPRPDGRGGRESTVGELSRTGSKSPRWALFLYCLARQLRPERVLELGTCTGISAAYLAACGAHVVTLDAALDLQRYAERNWRELGLDSRVTAVGGYFEETLPRVLEEHGPFDLVFVDGHHQEAPTERYYRAILPHLRPGAAVVFDDVAWSSGMRRVWRRLRADPSVASAVDLHKLGLVFPGAAPAPPPLHRVVL